MIGAGVIGVAADSEASSLLAAHRAEAQRIVSEALGRGAGRGEALRLARAPLLAGARARAMRRAEAAYLAAEGDRRGHP